jgi:para-aminobenzoate synthetase/4-amino-4-deoxychorismate lyase
MTTGRPWARFDDLQTGRAWLFPSPRHVVVASSPQEVLPALAEVDRATRAGSWAFGYVAYEAAAGIDPVLPVLAPRPDAEPLAWFGLCGPPERVSPVAPPQARPPAYTWRPDWTAADHARAVSAARHAIAAGETYQCNVADRLRAEGVHDPEALYAALAVAQRGAYNAYLDLRRFAVASASPELFLEWRADTVRTRPMKGTAARGATPGEDREQARRLRSSAKERAENLMIVDLLRNDLSRVARPGSVAVNDLFRLERYPTVWQLTSEVSALVPDEVGLADVFRALFPCGSVTGAPKRRTMQLICDLEPCPRGVYCGAVGLVAPPSAALRAVFNVAIRTAVVDRESGRAVYGVGSGITWDSDPASERAEVMAKAAVLEPGAGAGTQLPRSPRAWTAGGG